MTRRATPAGAVIITTPHTLAVKDAIKGINMFRTLNVPLLGLVQNMSLYTCPSCSSTHHIFGAADRALKICADQAIDFLGDVPLDPSIGDSVEEGKPVVVAEPTGKVAGIYADFAKQIATKIGLS